MQDDYMPIDPDFYDVIESIRKKTAPIKIHYFGKNNEICDAQGSITGVTINEKHEEYLVLDAGKQVRLDRIITLNGRPGSAYDEYDRYGLACLDCSGGME